MSHHLTWVLSLCVITSIAACDATDTATECVAADLIGQCPVGSNPVLGAGAATSCGGEFEGQTVGEGVAVTGQCSANGTCQFLCQFAVPCSCGVATLTKEEIVCSECAAQSCGDGRCEGTERPTCEPGQNGCQPCAEDCTGATCGDGDCTGEENPSTCPQDCGAVCTPNAQECIGNVLRKCSADGRDAVSIDCSSSGMVCQASTGNCVPGGACGNEVCDTSETPVSCPQDCATLCTPNTNRCENTTVVRCAADGRSETRTPCTEGYLCTQGECRPAGQCGNGVCEAGEDVGSCGLDCDIVCGNERCDDGENGANCPLDCATCGNDICEGEERITCVRDCPTCGNDICELQEEISCPADCTTCGNAICEENELAQCPQDCGVCTPNGRECIGDLLRVCTANGVAYEDFDCTAFAQICARGACATPNRCGNGACEPGEDETSCAADCREVCGNGACGVGEDFGRCSIDCPPTCGDGSCNGDERPASCALDCVTTCGNGACDGVEDRDNCPNDCGFCGNGICEDGAESPSLSPPAHLDACLVDCVVTECQNNADCDDEQACTTNSCVSGTCTYQPNDNACGANQKCIRFNGCCPDADRDGYADAACGGSDCDDSDGDVHPGAIEPCGGGDRNCNGTHKPTLKPAKKLTDTFSLKSDLHVSQGANGYLASWTGIPEVNTVIEYAQVTPTLALSGVIRTVPNRIATTPQSVYSPTRNAYGLTSNAAGLAELNFVMANGGLESVGPIAIAMVNPRSMVWAGGNYFTMTTFIAGSYPGTYNAGRYETTSEAGGVTSTGFNGVSVHYGYFNTVVGGGNVNVLTGQTVQKINVSDVNQMVSIALQGDHGAGGRIAWDGQYLSRIVRNSAGTHYVRYFPNGFIESESVATTMLIDPMDVVTVPASAGNPATVGVLLNDGTSNLYLLVRNQDGSEALPPGLVGGGQDVNDGFLFWDGQQFVVFWRAKQNQIHQIYATTVSCE